MDTKLIKKGPGIHPGPFLKNYIFLATARIDITTAGVNITATKINHAAATRINNIATGLRGFSIRTFGIFWFFIVTHTITPFVSAGNAPFPANLRRCYKDTRKTGQYMALKPHYFKKNRGCLQLIRFFIRQSKSDL